MSINSASNRQLTLLRKLNRKKYRQKEQLFLLEGARAVQQVVDTASISIKALFFDEEQQYYLKNGWQEITRHIDSYTLTAGIFAEVSDTDTPQGILAMCYMPPEITVEDLAEKKGIIVAFDGVQDPGNLGTIIRTATWFEAVGLISGRGTVDLFHPKVVRGTAGATGTIPHLNGNLSEILPDLEKSGWQVLLLDAGTDSIPLPEVNPTEQSLIVVGNEAHGVDPDLMAEPRKKVRIPSPQKKPKVESLNAGVAASIALFDITGKQN